MPKSFLQICKKTDSFKQSRPKIIYLKNEKLN